MKLLVGTILLIGLVGSAVAEEPTGFRDVPWGSSWDIQRFRSLPGCEQQGSILTFLSGAFVEVVHPECVNYKLSDKTSANLILTFSDLKMNVAGLEGSQISLRNLVINRRTWGLTASQAVPAELRLIEVNKLVALRRLNGDDLPIFPDMAERRSELPSELRGLQAYQINFAHEHYGSIRAAAIERFGQPTSEVAQGFQTLGGAAFSGQRLIWVGERTVAILREYGGTVRSGYLAVGTRDYVKTLQKQEAASGEQIKRGF